MLLSLLLVRHGETRYNRERRFQGQRDIPLSDTGRAQADALAQRLVAAWHPQRRGPLLPSVAAAVPGPPDAVFTSDLVRAAETGAVLAGALAAKAGIQPGLTVRALSSLRERSFGAWEGMTREEIRRRFPEQTHGPEDAEPWPEVWNRMMEALDTIWNQTRGAAASPEEAVALVAGHGGSLRALICRAIGIGHEHIHRFRLDNASLSVVQFQGDEFLGSEGHIVLLNDTAHLNLPHAREPANQG